MPGAPPTTATSPKLPLWLHGARPQRVRRAAQPARAAPSAGDAQRVEPDLAGVVTALRR